MRTVYAHQGETLDALLYRVVGATDGITERVLEMNPGLADKGPILAEGTAVQVPETPTGTRRIETIQLWT